MSDELRLTPDELEKLLVEVVMGVAERDSLVPLTAESRQLREILRKQAAELKRRGIAPDIPFN